MSLALYNELIQQSVIPTTAELNAVAENAGFRARAVVNGRPFSHWAARKKLACSELAAIIIDTLQLKPRSKPEDFRQIFLDAGGKIEISATYSQDALGATVVFRAPDGSYYSFVDSYTSLNAISEFIKAKSAELRIVKDHLSYK